jgi:hypothetical protein
MRILCRPGLSLSFPIRWKPRLSRKFSLSEILSILLISGQAALFVFMWFRLLDDPSLKTMDFVSFYGAGRLARESGYGQIYDFNAEVVVQRQVVGLDDYDPLIFNHPPYVVPLLALIADEDYVLAYVHWTIWRLLFLVGCAWMVRRFLLRSGWDARSAWLGTLGCITFFPIIISLLDGQDTVFTLTGLLVWMFALLEGREMFAGIGLAFATLAPTIAGALALPLFASRRRAGLWFIAGVLVLAVYSISLVGMRGLRDFLNLLQVSSRGQYYGFDWSTMYNLLGLLVRSFPGLDLGTARSIAWIVVFLSMAVLCILWWNRRERLRIEHIGIAVVLTTFTSPHLNSHGLSYLLLPLLGAIAILWSRGHPTAALLFLPFTSTILVLVIFMKPEWNFAIYHTLMFLLAYGLWSNLKRPRQESQTDS